MDVPTLTPPGNILMGIEAREEPGEARESWFHTLATPIKPRNAQEVAGLIFTGFPPLLGYHESPGDLVFESQEPWSDLWATKELQGLRRYNTNCCGCSP